MPVTKQKLIRHYAMDQCLRYPDFPFVQVPLAPTIGLLLCPTKSNEKVRFSLRGFSQPMGVAEYEIKQLIEKIQSALPSIEDKA